jgi:hypothetical protein
LGEPHSLGNPASRRSARSMAVGCDEVDDDAECNAIGEIRPARPAEQPLHQCPGVDHC